MSARAPAWHDQYDAWVTATIRKVGWVIHYVGGDSCSRPGCECPPDDGPPFAYTTGLFGLGHPELLVFGLDPDTTAAVLNEFGSRIKAGEQFLVGMEIELAGGHHKFIPEAVPNPGEIVFESNRFYQRPDEASVPVLQLSYDDGTGCYPWDPDYPVPEMQPRPGTFRA